MFQSLKKIEKKYNWSQIIWAKALLKMAYWNPSAEADGKG